MITRSAHVYFNVYHFFLRVQNINSYCNIWNVTQNKSKTACGKHPKRRWWRNVRHACEYSQFCLIFFALLYFIICSKFYNFSVSCVFVCINELNCGIRFMSRDNLSLSEKSFYYKPVLCIQSNHCEWETIPMKKKIGWYFGESSSIPHFVTQFRL